MILSDACCAEWIFRARVSENDMPMSAFPHHIHAGSCKNVHCFAIIWTLYIDNCVVQFEEELYAQLSAHHQTERKEK